MTSQGERMNSIEFQGHCHKDQIKHRARYMSVLKEDARCGPIVYPVTKYLLKPLPTTKPNFSVSNFMREYCTKNGSGITVFSDS